MGFVGGSVTAAAQELPYQIETLSPVVVPDRPDREYQDAGGHRYGRSADGVRRRSSRTARARARSSSGSPPMDD